MREYSSMLCSLTSRLLEKNLDDTIIQRIGYFSANFYISIIYSLCISIYLVLEDYYHGVI